MACCEELASYGTRYNKDMGLFYDHDGEETMWKVKYCPFCGSEQ